MTLAKAAQITQMEVSIELVGDDWKAEARDAGGRKASGTGETESDALEDLVRDNYRRVCVLVNIAQNRRCANCGKVVPLQFHHKLHRSGPDGRIDTFDNLKGVCHSCHAIEHRRKKVR